MTIKDKGSVRKHSASGRQFTLLSLLGVITFSAIGLAIFAQFGGWAIFMIGLAAPMILFGIFCTSEAVTTRQPGWISNVFIGVSLICFGTTVIVHALVVMDLR